MAKKQIKKKRPQSIRALIKKQVEETGSFVGEFKPAYEEQAPSIARIVTKVLNEVTKGNHDSSLNVILSKQVTKAQAGDLRAAEFLFDRAFGKPTQTVVQNSAPVVTIQHNVISVQEARGDES